MRNTYRISQKKEQNDNKIEIKEVAISIEEEKIPSSE